MMGKRKPLSNLEFGMNGGETLIKSLTVHVSKAVAGKNEVLQIDNESDLSTHIILVAKKIKIKDSR